MMLLKMSWAWTAAMVDISNVALRPSNGEHIGILVMFPTGTKRATILDMEDRSDLQT